MGEVHGYVVTTLGERRPIRWPGCSWDQLMVLIDQNRVNELTRTQQVMNAYGQHRAKVLSEYETIDGYVKCCELGYPTEVLPNGKLRAGELSGELRRGRLVLTPNKFPYDLAQGIEHYILWRVGCSDDDDGGVQLSPETIARYIDEESGLKAKSQQNPILLHASSTQSMPEIPHCHLVVLLK